jgi:hypothetical protein
MGAMAISMIAGSLLIANAPDVPFLRFVASLPEGFHRVLLGDRNMVDPHACYSCHVEVCLQTISIEVRSSILGWYFSSEHVYRLYVPDGQSDGTGIS